MNFDRALCVLDVETTGVDPVSDRIVEIAILRVAPSFEVVRFKQGFNPERPIPAEATAIHGITNADMADAPTFGAMAGEVLQQFVGADICGYNLRRLDLPILDQELRRAGFARGLPLHDAKIIDCYGIFAKKHARALADAVRIFCGREHVEAHDAMSDALATLDVLHGQLANHPDLAAMSVAELAKFSNHGDHDYADLAGKLYRDADGDLRYSFGKAKDVKVRDDMGYANWMLNKASFPGNTNDVLEAELDRLDKESGPVTDAEPEDLF